MVGIANITDAELIRWTRELPTDSDAYICAVDELAFRHRHPEYRVA